MIDNVKRKMGGTMFKLETANGTISMALQTHGYSPAARGLR